MAFACACECPGKLFAGPVLGLLDPKAVFGNLMTPIISITFAVILFEGGLMLNFHQLRDAQQRGYADLKNTRPFHCR